MARRLPPHSSHVSLTARADAAAEAMPAPQLDLETVYQTHFAFVWRSLRRLGVSDSLLPDASHDVFVVAHRRLGDFQGRSSIKTWLFGIALRIAAAYRRRAARSSRPLCEPLENRTAYEDPRDQAEAQRLVRRALAMLDEERRTVFILADLERMSASEIAQTLGIPLGTVYTRVRLARRDFEAHLRSFGFAPSRRQSHDK